MSSKWVAAWRERFRALFFGARQEAEMDEELHFHLEQEAELLRQTGLDPRESRRQAQLRFGGVERCKEEVRDARGVRALENLATDLRIAARSLARKPGFAIAVVLTLGVGIGATTTIYSVVDGVMLRPLPYDDASTLVTVGSTTPAQERVEEPGLRDLGRLSMLSYVSLDERGRSFEHLAAVEPTNVFLADAGEGPDEVKSARVASEFFPMLGVAPAQGRAFLPQEHRIGSEAVVMISHGAWQRRYGGDPAAVGQPAERFLQPTVIVGVLPQGFRPPEALFPADAIPEFWLPLQPEHRRYARQRPTVSVLGRLAQGVTMDQAQREASRIATALATEFPDANTLPDGSYSGIGLNGLHAQTVGTTGAALGVFLGAAGLLLLLAAMNAGTLFLARLLDRGGELGVRMALGASRAQILSLLACEAGILAACAWGLGVALAFGGVALFVEFAPASILSLSSVALNVRVLGVAAVLSLGTGIAAGLLPALRRVQPAPWERLRAGEHTSGEPPSRIRPILVGGQMALAVILLSGASLLFTSFVRIRSADPGFEPDGLITAGVGLEGALRSSEPGTVSTVWQAWDLALEGIGAIPGVDSVAGTTTLPFQVPSWAPRLLLPGDAPDTWREGITGYAITPGYLATMGIQLRQGRDFERADRDDTQRVVLVNESFVRTQLRGRDPIDLILRHAEGASETPVRVVGVVEDVVQTRVEDGPRPAIYMPHTQRSGPLRAVIRTRLPTAVVAPALRRAVARFNPIEPVRDLRTMRDRMGATRTSPRFQAALVAAFAMVAVLLAAAGLYSALAHSVGRRQRELGLRMALGANRGGVLRLVLRQGMTVSLTGLTVGIAAALLFARALEGLLYGVKPNDPVTLLAAGGMLALISAAACLAPARRATALDLVAVLKNQ